MNQMCCKKKENSGISLFTTQENFRLVQIESICRWQNKGD